MKSVIDKVDFRQYQKTRGALYFLIEDGAMSKARDKLFAKLRGLTHFMIVANLEARVTQEIKYKWQPKATRGWL